MIFRDALPIDALKGLPSKETSAWKNVLTPGGHPAYLFHDASSSLENLGWRVKTRLIKTRHNLKVLEVHQGALMHMGYIVHFGLFIFKTEKI